jgi:hypothetical protein
MWRAIRRRIVGNSDLALCALLAVIGLWLVKGLDQKKVDEAVVLATLAGALFGAAAVLLGNWINRANEWRRAAEELDERQEKLKMLSAAELVNVAAGYLSTKQLIDSALESLYSTGGSLPDHHAILTPYLPRNMPLTNSLGLELLTLEKSAIDALVTLQSNLTITRMRMEEAAGGEYLGLLRLGGIAAGLAHDMGILAECFDQVAPTRELKLTDKPAELASVLLRRAASEEKAQPKGDEY